MVNQASLLGIPREIRQNIYEYVIHLDLDYDVVERYGGYFEGRGYGTTMCRDAAKTLVVPWVSLLLACRAVGEEVGAYMRSARALAADAARTYAMDISGSGTGYLRAATWRGVPCAPSDARAVAVDITLEASRAPGGSVHTWGCGGPRPVVRQLYQTLNLLLHNGPMLGRASPLRSLLKLESLDLRIIVVASGGGGGSEDPADLDRSPATTSGSDSDSVVEEAVIGPLLTTLKDVSLLWGYVNRISLTEGRRRREITIEPVEDAAVPSHWDGYGFEWGRRPSVKWETPEVAEARRRIRKGYDDPISTCLDVL